MGHYMGYFQTPNTQIPYNNRPAGEIAQVAKDQLTIYLEAAENWPLCIDVTDLRACHRCTMCGQNIWFGNDQNYKDYNYTQDEITTLIVAHIRQAHDKEDPWN